MPIVALSVTYVHAFHAEETAVNYPVMFGVALVRLAAPQILKCAWEEVVVFPKLESALNPSFEGIRLMDVLDMLSTDHIVTNLLASGFVLGDDNRVVHMWAQKSSISFHTPQTLLTPIPGKPTSPSPTPSGSENNYPDSSKKLLREHISKDMKRSIKSLVIDLFPRDTDGVILSDTLDSQTTRRPAWVMDELYRSLKLNYDKEEASKGLDFAKKYVKRERARQVRVVSIDSEETKGEREDLKSEAIVWREGPYGRLWAANLTDRPRPQQLLSVVAGKEVDTRCAMLLYITRFCNVHSTIKALYNTEYLLLFVLCRTTTKRITHSSLIKPLCKENICHEEDDEDDEASDLPLNLQDAALAPTGVSEFERGWAVNEMTKTADAKRKKEIAARKAATTSSIERPKSSPEVNASVAKSTKPTKRGRNH